MLHVYEMDISISSARYIVINTGYTSRITVDDLHHVIDEHDAYEFRITLEDGTLVGESLPGVVGEPYGSIIVSRLDNDSINLARALDMVHEIAGLEFAGFLTSIWGIRYKMDTAREKAIIIDIDSESG